MSLKKVRAPRPTLQDQSEALFKRRYRLPTGHNGLVANLLSSGYYGLMGKAAISEIKNHLSAYLKRCRQANRY